MKDLSVLRALGQKLIEQERTIWNFFALSNDLYCTANRDGHFTRLNPAWERILGWEEEEMLRRPWLDFVHHEDIENTIHAAETMQARSISGFENRYRAKDGRWLWLRWTSMQWDEGGNTICLAREVSGIKRAEELIQAVCDDYKDGRLYEALMLLQSK